MEHWGKDYELYGKRIPEKGHAIISFIIMMSILIILIIIKTCFIYWKIIQ
jgi:hypothetical protein